MTKNEELLEERGKTHGDWKKQARLAQELKLVFRHLKSSGELSEAQIEAVEMIFVKISRIGTGNSSVPDHWNDIAGYAALGRDS